LARPFVANKVRSVYEIILSETMIFAYFWGDGAWCHNSENHRLNLNDHADL